MVYQSKAALYKELYDAMYDDLLHLILVNWVEPTIIAVPNKGCELEFHFDDENVSVAVTRRHNASPVTIVAQYDGDVEDLLEQLMEHLFSNE